MDSLARLDILADQFVENAHLFHNMAQPLYALFIIKVGAAAKLLDALAGDNKTLAGFLDLPFVRFVSQGQDGDTVIWFGGLGSFGANGRYRAFYSK